MTDVLLTVSGVIPPAIRAEIAAGLRPVTDYIALADRLPANLLDYQRAAQEAGRFGQLLCRLGGANLVLAWICYRKRRDYRVILTDGEQVGLPLALMLKFGSGRHRPRHLMITHVVSVTKKKILLDYLGLASHIDLFLVYSTWQREFVLQRWRVPAERVHLTPFMVDSDFFSAKAVEPAATATIPKVERDGRPLLCAVGLECRDYPTLLKAVAGLNAQVVIAAASPWSKRHDSTRGQTIPENVTVCRFSQFELRQLYAQSEALLTPLYEVNFQAGVTALLEAMAMGKPLICTRTPGQTDVVIEGETGLYVPPGDPEALRATIVALLADPLRRRRMGAAGRARVEKEMNLIHYVNRLQTCVDQMRRFSFEDELSIQ